MQEPVPARFAGRANATCQRSSTRVLAATEARDHGTNHVRPGFWALALGSVGVVYGDIGTSPLYALREALLHAQEGGVSREEVLGVTSLLLWALIFIVTGKYVLFLMRADNRGEGGTLSLMALAQRALGRSTPAGVPPGRRRCRPVLRRRADHARDLGALRGRGAQAGDAGVRALRRPDHRGHPAGPVRGPAAGHRQGGGLVRPDHRLLVPGHGGAGPASISATISGVLAAFSPHHAFGVPVVAWRRRLRRAGQRVSRGHRHRGALRRHGPFRPRRRSRPPGSAWCSRRWR